MSAASQDKEDAKSTGENKNPYIVGRPVDGKEMFFGRQDVFEFVRRNLTGRFQDNAIVLYGEPRTGKTSILRQMQDQLGESYVCVHIDLSEITLHDVGIFLWHIADKIWKALERDGLEVQQPLLSEFSLPATKDPLQHFANVFLGRMETVIGEKHLLILFDEAQRLGMAVREGRLSKEIFPFLKSLIQSQAVMNALFCLGSQPLAMDREFSSAFGSSFYREISFLDRQAAMDLIEKPVKGSYGYSLEAMDEIFRRTSGHPYFIQLICHHLFNRWQEEQRALITESDVEAVLEEVVEASRMHLLDIWTRQTDDEKLVLAALAERITEVGVAMRADIEQVLKGYEVKMAPGQITSAIQGLSEAHTIRWDEPYFFRVDVFRLWIQRERKLEWVKEELSKKEDAARRAMLEQAEKVREHYLRFVRDECGWLDFRGLLLLPEMFSLPLQDIYVPLYVTASRSEELFRDLALRARARYLAEKLSDREGEVSLAMRREVADEMRRLATTLYQNRVDARQMLSGNPCLIILGDPGAGKTTFMRYVALLLAEGKARELGLEGNWLPILLPIGAYANVRRMEDADLTLAEYLPRYFVERRLDLPEISAYFKQELSAGRCMVLLDGLDTVVDNAERLAVAREVESFIDQYPHNRYIITSRIEGYREASISGDFLHCTATDLEMVEIEKFAQKWSEACETHVGITEQRKASAEVLAERLIEAIKASPGVRRLAANPLLLTIIALAFRQGRLPHHRILLYAECVRTLIERWNWVHGLIVLPEGVSVDATEAINIFSPLALWMHEEKPSGMVSNEDLRAELRVLLMERGLPEEDAEAARDAFQQIERHQVGLLVERGVNAYGFSHLTFEEYFAAREIARNRDKIDSHIPRNLHDPRWREVILLTAGQIGIQQNEEVAVTKLVQMIVRNNSPLETILHRDLLLAGRCLGDDVRVAYRERKELLQQLVQLWHQTTFERLRREITDVLATMRGTQCEADVVKALLDDLTAENDEIRQAAADALGKMGMTSDKVLQALTKALREGHSQVRAHAALALSRLNVAPEQVTDALSDVLLKDSDREVRLRTAEALAHIGQATEQAIDLLLAALDSKDGNVRGSAATALASMKYPSNRLVDSLLKALRDARADVRTNAADILGRLGQHSSQAVEGLIEMLHDEEENARISAAMALSQVGDTSNKVVYALVERLGDEKWLVRRNAAAALGKLAGTGAENILSALRAAVQKEHTRVGAADALGRAGREDFGILGMTEKQLETGNWQDRIHAVEALVKLDKGDAASQKVIETLADVLEEEHRMGWDVMAGTAITLAEVAKRSDAALNSVVKLLDHGKWLVRASAAEALGKTEKVTPEVVKALIHTMQKDSDDHARGNAAAALGALGQKDDNTIEMLIMALRDEQGYVRLSAASALAKLGVRGNKRVLDGLCNLLEDGYYSHYNARHVRDVAFDALWALAPYSREEAVN